MVDGHDRVGFDDDPVKEGIRSLQNVLRAEDISEERRRIAAIVGLEDERLPPADAGRLEAGAKRLAVQGFQGARAPTGITAMPSGRT